MAGKRILIVSTSFDKLGTSDEPTGLWIEELAAPYFIFKEAGAHVDVTSIKGGHVPIDPNSLGDSAVTEHVKRYHEDLELKKALEETKSIKEVTGKYDAVFVPGGHGIVYDGPNDKDLIAFVEKIWSEGGVVGAVCHGPAALVNVHAPNGELIVKGRKVAGFSNSEEEAVGRTKYVPFLLEDKLKESGGLYERAPDWQPFAVADGKLVLGQNPASSPEVAKLILAAI